MCVVLCWVSHCVCVCLCKGVNVCLYARCVYLRECVQYELFVLCVRTSIVLIEN